MTSNKTEHTNDDLYSRLAQTETEVSNLKEGLATVNTNVSNISRNVDIVIESIRELRSDVGSNKETNWPLILGICVIIVSLLGIVSGIYIRDMDRLYASVDKNEQRHYEMMIRKLNEKL